MSEAPAPPLRPLSRTPEGDLAPDELLLRAGLAELFPPGAFAAEPPGALRQFERQMEARGTARRRRARLARWTLAAAGLSISVAAGALAFAILPARPSPVRALGVGDATLDLLACGAQVAAQGHVTVDERDALRPLVLVERGTARLVVPKLPGGAALRVRTAEAEVVVHGTRFLVARDDGATLVSVEEGLVEVRPVDPRTPVRLLSGGQRAEVLGPSRQLARLLPGVEAAVEGVRCDSEIDLQQFLLLAAKDHALRAGAEYVSGFCAALHQDRARAVALFEAAAQHSKDPAQVDNALARAAQLRALMDPADGWVAWRRYLERVPDGLQRAHAEKYLKQERGRR